MRFLQYSGPEDEKTVVYDSNVCSGIFRGFVVWRKTMFRVQVIKLPKGKKRIAVYGP